MALFVGLDVSLKLTSVCIVEADGSPVWEGKAESDPTSLIQALTRWREGVTLVGIEACPLSEWLYGALVESGFQTVCIETRHAQRFLSSRPNKTDRSDARGIADMMRLGHYRAVHVKSKASQLVRTTLVARKKFVEHMLAIEITIRGLLKVHGLKLGALHRCQFAAKVGAMLADAPDLRIAIEPLLEARNMMRKQKAIMDRQLSQMARTDEVCRRLMTISGVGPIVSLSFKATIDDPKRFKDSKAVPAHLGLTPRVYQSGEIDRSGSVSKCGDKMMRHALYEAANSHLRISKKWSVLRAWASSSPSASAQRKHALRGHVNLRSSCTACGWTARISALASRPSHELRRRSFRRSNCTAEDVGRGQSVSIPVLCSHQARAVSLDDLASPNPIVERTYGSTPDRSADQAEAGLMPQICGNDRHSKGGDASRLRSQARACE